MNRRSFLSASASLGMALTMPALRTLEANELPADLTDLSASELSSAIRQRLVSCVEVMRGYLERIDRYNPSGGAACGLATHMLPVPTAAT